MAGAHGGELTAHQGWINCFIWPGYRFHVLDGLITNFHLPESTLLMLVSALTGRERMLETYTEAVKMEYRFFSYGDAMSSAEFAKMFPELSFWKIQQPSQGRPYVGSAFFVLAIAAALVVLRLAKKAGLDIMPCG